MERAVPHSPERRPTARPWLVLIVLCLGAFAILLDTTIVNVALPSLITSLHASLDQGIWVVNAYLLVFCALLILASRLGDMFGPRRLFIAGLAVFAVASALCGAAQSPGELIAARALQGIGAAALTPQAMVIIQSVFPRERMGAAFGVFSSMVGLAAVSGPSLGGLLTTYLSWRWVFYVNLPIAAAGIAAAIAFVPTVAAGHRHRLDLGGVLLATAGLSALTYGVIEGPRYDWGEVGGGITIGEIIAAGAVLLAGFVAWEWRQGLLGRKDALRRSAGRKDALRRSAGRKDALRRFIGRKDAVRPEPLVPLGLFRSRTFTIMVVLNVVVQFALQSMLLVNSINLQSVLGFTAVHAGLTSLPLTLALSALAPFAGRLTDRFGGKFVLMAGLAVYGLGIAGLAAVASVHATSLTYAPVLLVAGIGMGAIFAPLATMALRAAPPQLAGAASGVLNTGRQLGATLGGTISGAILASRLSSAARALAPAAARALPPAARPAFTGGFAQAAKAGLQVGRGETAVHLPRGVPDPLAAQIRQLARDVFGHSYITAMHTALAIPVALLLAGAAACFLLRRTATTGSSPAAGENAHRRGASHEEPTPARPQPQHEAAHDHEEFLVLPREKSS